MRFSRSILLLLTWVLIKLPAPAWAEGIELADRENLISAYIYNFARFTQWDIPRGEQSNQVVTFCTLGGDGLSKYLALTIEGEQVNNKPALYREVTVDDFAGCYILLVEQTKMAEWALIRQAVAAHGNILTIGEHASFVNQGGIVSFVQRGRKLKPVVNIAELQRCKLKISSKLLRLSTLVGQ
jgi:hypothetical protein